ncbi:uncharacterized protein LOC143973741 isoform X3 [Lithobates pipiens]
MTDNYKNLTALGLSASPPEIVLKIERGEDPCVDIGEETAVLSSADNVAVNGRTKEGQTRWTHWKRASQRPAARGVSRRSLRLVRRASRSGEEEASTKKSPESPSHNGVTLEATLHNGSSEERSDLGGAGLSPGSESLKTRAVTDRVEQERQELSGNAEKTHACAHCGESWSHLIDFVSHQMGNCQDRPHRCSICGKTFVKKQHLAAHRKTHTEDRPYTCNQCGQSFRQNSTLTTHLWSHAGHKPFHCTCCPKSFSRKTDLVAHVRRHTGERPYQCPYCWDRFIRKKSLQRHLQKHSGENLRTGWEQSFPRWRETTSCMERDPKVEECPTETPPTPPHPEPAIEFSFRCDAEQKADAQNEDRPLLEGQECTGSASGEVVKVEKLHSPVSTSTDRATQTENTRPGRIQQQVLRELRRCRKSAARAQNERDCMRAAMDHLMQEMKELKEMMGAANASSSVGPPQPSAALAQDRCSLWNQTPEERQCTEPGRASPESSLHCAYRSPLDTVSDQRHDRLSWLYRNSPDLEDDMLPTTTIKREEEEPEPSPSPEFPFYRLPQYASLQTGERLPNIAVHPLSTEKEWTLLARSAGKPGRFAALVFRALIPFDIYKSWVNRVNLDGLRGRKGIPLNVKQRVMAIVERHFSLRKCDHSEVRNRLNEQLRTRRKSDKLPPSLYQPVVPY